MNVDVFICYSPELRATIVNTVREETAKLGILTLHRGSRFSTYHNTVSDLQKIKSEDVVKFTTKYITVTGVILMSSPST